MHDDAGGVIIDFVVVPLGTVVVSGRDEHLSRGRTAHLVRLKTHFVDLAVGRRANGLRSRMRCLLHNYLRCRFELSLNWLLLRFSLLILLILLIFGKVDFLTLFLPWIDKSLGGNIILGHVFVFVTDA